MADLARPALPEVLAALTSEPHAPAWESVAQRVVAGPEDVRICALPDTYVILPARWPWTTTDPTEAAELLVTREVLPAGWHGDTRRGWLDRVAADDGWGDWRSVVLPTPRSIPDLVAVASLGWPAIQRAEELARAACHALREYGCPTPDRVVWRVGDRGPAHREVYARDVGYPGGIMLCANGSCIAEAPAGNVCSIDARAARELWDSGLALDRITPDAVVVVVPPVGGVR